MTYTVSHQQEGVSRAHAEGLVHDVFRVDLLDGLEWHSEPGEKKDIDLNLTSANVSRMWREGEMIELDTKYQGEDGNSHQIKQILGELDRRLESANGQRVNKKTNEVMSTKIREDAGVIRHIYLQLDPWFTKHSHQIIFLGDDARTDEVRDFLEVMVDHYAELYGRNNLLASSFHLDQTYPHTHLLVTPIDDQGRVRQQSFIRSGRGPKCDMAKNDQAMRSRLKNSGYDVNDEPDDGRRKSMSAREYERLFLRQAEVLEREHDVLERELNVEYRELDLANREFNVMLDEEDIDPYAGFGD